MSVLARRRGRVARRNRASGFDPAYDDVRLFKTIGIQQFDSWAGTATEMDAEYTKYMKAAYHGDGSVFFGVRSVVRWNTSLKDETVTPTLAEMRNPNWAGYAWNDATGNPTGTHTLDTMRNATCVQNGQAKALMQISVSATSGTPVPAFMMAGATLDANSVEQSEYAWRGNDVAGDGVGDVRVKFWNATARQYAANFVLAAIDRFLGTGSGGNNIASVKLGEYYAGNIRPADFPAGDGYDNGYWQFQGLVANEMSAAADGKRVWIHQANPIPTATYGLTDLITRKMGASASDPHMFESPALQFDRANYHGIIPMAAPGDSPNYVNTARTSGIVTWEVPPDNPFGFTHLQEIDIEPIHGAWFYGHGGPMPMDQEMIYGVGGVNRTLTGEPQNTFMMAMDALGPGGTWYGTGTGKWGGVPFMG